jgi:hypothetical protein
MPVSADRRLANLRAALGFLQLAPRAPELRLLHRWLDTWAGLGLITVGVERLSDRRSLTHVADAEWRAAFTNNPMFAPVGYGVAKTASGRCSKQPGGHCNATREPSTGCLEVGRCSVLPSCLMPADQHTQAHECWVIRR